MMANGLSQLAARTATAVAGFGDFCRFSGRTLNWSVATFGRWRMVRLLLEQMYQVGTRSIPVVMITGAFVGMVLAAQSVLQFKAMGMEAKLGSIINLSVVRELGPVLAGVVLAGRVGGALAAELGTMRVTEQIDALRAMGADPVCVLVVPRFLACLLLMPVLVLYTNLMGIVGGYAISVHVYRINAAEFWQNAAFTVETFDIFMGLLKSVFFAGVMSLICCYRGFRCQPGAAGVGRACTKGFVESCMAVLALDFFLGVLLNTIYSLTWGAPPLM
ncbi:MAG: MlaE family ABC transporter permease [Planctomycetota bacterium]|jgi:phospholipid/cholesterol/gamma-HCH transport system permease protein